MYRIFYRIELHLSKLLTMGISNIYFVVIIGVLTVILTILTLKKNFIDVKFLKFDKKLNRDKLVIIISGLIMIFLVYQDRNNQFLSDRKDSILKKEQKDRDSIISEGINEGVNKIYNQISNAYANQGIILDSILEKGNQAKIITNNYITKDIEPVLSIIDNNAIAFTNNHFRIDFESKGANSTNFDINCKLLIEFNNDSLLLQYPKIFFKETVILWKVNAPLTNTIKNVKNLFIYMKGTYSNLSLTKTFQFDQVVQYNAETKLTSLLIDKRRELIISLMKDLEQHKK